MDDSATLTGLIFAGRTLQFSGGMLLVNVALFRGLVLPSAPAGAGGSGVARFIRRLDTTLFVSACALAFSGVLLFLGAAAGMSGTPLSGVLDASILSTVLLQTEFGHVWQVRLALAVALLPLTAWLRFGRPRSRVARLPLGAVTALLAAALFLSVGLVSHAAAVDRPGFPWPLLADVAHLASTCVWPGGLLPFALFLGCVKSAEAPNLDFIVKTVRRFSAVSLAGVLSLALTGTANACFLVGTFAHLFGSAYGHLLCWKLFVFLLMLGVAAWNREVLLPRLFAAEIERNVEGVTHAVRALRSFVWAEVALALAVIMVVSVLGVTPPPAGP